MEVTSKEKNFRLLKRGSFGNKLRTWGSRQEVLNSGYRGTVTMRYRGDGGGSFYAYEVPLRKIRSVEREWSGGGLDVSRISFNESAPDDFLVIQGEVMRGVEGLELFYSTKQMKMRDAMVDGGARSARGLTAKLLLETHLNPSSFADLEVLLDGFPDHVVEFSTYRFCLGDIPGRNTVIWEVRKY